MKTLLPLIHLCPTALGYREMVPTNLSRDLLHKVILAVVLLMAAVLLLARPGLAEFKLDEATVSRQALALVREGAWPTPTDTDIPGLPQSPGKAILLTVPYAFTRNPEVAILFQGLLGVAAVWLTYRFGSRYFNVRVGLMASALFATTPWAVFFTRKLWQQNVPFFTLIMMFGLWEFVIHQKHRRIFVAFLMLGVLASLYLGNLILSLTFVFSVAANPRCLLPGDKEHGRWKPLVWLGGGLAAFFVILSPYLYQVFSGRVEIGKTMELASTSVGQKFHLAEQIDLAAAVGTGDQFHSLAGDQFRAFIGSLPASGSPGVLDKAAVWVVIAGMTYVIVRAGLSTFRRSESMESSRRNEQAYILLAIWLIVPIGLWTLSGLTPYIHRYNMLYPTQALVTSVLLLDGYDWLVAHRRRFVSLVFQYVVGLWLVALIVWHVILYVGMLDFVSQHGIVGGYGRPVQELWSAAQKARQLAGPEQLPIVVHTDGADPEYESGAAGFDAVLGDFYLYLLGDSRLEVAPLGSYVWIWDDGMGSYTVEMRASPPVPDSSPLAHLANGVDLVSVDASQPKPGQSMPVTLTWQVWNPDLASLDYGYTVQLYAVDGQRWGQVDGQFVRSVYWRKGDLVTVSVDVPIDAEAPASEDYHLLVAMYGYLPEAQQGVDVLDIAGNPSGQSITIPLN
jgi:4-amino-4-deoxy-L-arabinose transferase-like glycosyltransferase